MRVPLVIAALLIALAVALFRESEVFEARAQRDQRPVAPAGAAPR